MELFRGVRVLERVRFSYVSAVAIAAITFATVLPAGPTELSASAAFGQEEVPAAVESERPDDHVLGEDPETAAIATETVTAINEAVAGGEPVEVLAATTPTARLVALPNASLQLESSTVPVRTQEDDGEWVPIDTELVLRDGWWEPRASATPVRFSAGGNSDLDQIRMPGGEWLTESWPNGVLPIPVIDGRTATYPDVYPDVDLRLTATELGMASVYIVKTARASADPRLAELQVHLEEAEVVRDPSGFFTAENKAGETMTASHPLWWDSSEGGNAEGPGDRAAAMPVEHSLEEGDITLDVAETVDGVSPTYPIFVDPDWSTGPNAAWYTDAAYPNVSYLSAGASDVLRMGRYSNFRGNAFFEFNIAPLAGKQVLGAQLSMTQVSVAASPNSPVQLRPFGHQNAGFTWNQQNHGLWGGVIGTQSPGYWQGPPVSVGWDVTSSIASRVGQTWAQFGLAPQDENAQSRRHFSRSATLTVNYNTPPNRPTDPKFVTPSTSCGTAASPRLLSVTSVVVSVQQTDPDPENVDVNFNLYKTSDLANRIQWRNPGLGAQGTKSVTFNDLVDGQAYAWNARGSDWKIDGNGSTEFCYFTVDRTGPSAPTFSSPTTAPVVGIASPLTIKTKPSDGVAFIAYTMLPAGNSSSFVFPYFGSAPPCASVQGRVRIACPNAAGDSIVSVVPTDSVSRLLAVSYDVAGNPALIPGTPSGKPGSVGAGFTVNAANSPNVSFDAGHVWLTQSQQSPLGSVVPDTNGAAPVPLELGPDVTRDKTANPRAPAVPIPKAVLEFSRTSPSGLTPYVVWSSERLGQYLSQQSTGPGSEAIYYCNESNSPWIWGIGTTALCNSLLSWPTFDRIGYTWADRADNSGIVPLGLCERTLPPPYEPEQDEFRFYMGTKEQCSTDRFIEGNYGNFLQEYRRTTTQSGVIRPTASFTVASWLKPGVGGAASAFSTDTSVPGFQLGATASQWQFCLSRRNVTPVCATAPRPANADWTHISGVWDAANGEMRLYIRGSLAATTPYVWPAGTDDLPTSIYVGGAHKLYAKTENWTGLIADPAVFAGVATPAQLGTLADGQDPANG